MCSDDFDFSVKGKGHHSSAAKGKSPTKKTEAERDNSKENQKVSARKAATTPTTPSTNNKRGSITSRSAAAATATPPTNERPKRELRKRRKSEPTAVPETPVSAPPEEPDHDLNDDDMDDDDDDKHDSKAPVSNVKLKVKVGYTSSGAMIRPAANGARKKKRRFRNLNVKKPSPAASTTKAAAATTPSKPVEEVAKKEPASVGRTRQSPASAKKRSKSLSEPVAGPSGLQKVKRSPRRVLKRKTTAAVGGTPAAEEDDDDDEDYEYYSSLYPPGGAGAPGSKSSNNMGDIQSDRDQIQAGIAKVQEKLNAANQSAQSVNGAAASAVDQQTNMNGSNDVGPMIAMDEDIHVGRELTASDMTQEEQLEESQADLMDGQMQVVVIGDSVEALHNYAKPPSL